MTLLIGFIPVGSGAEAPGAGGDGAQAGTGLMECTGSRSIVPNEGQLDNSDVRFYIPGGGLWLTDDGVVMDIRGDEGVGGVVLAHEFVGGDPSGPVGGEAMESVSNFYMGSDPALWRTGVPNYGMVLYESVFDDIDARYMSTSDGMKYELVVHPGADPADIRLRYSGVDALTVDAGGDLILSTAIGDVRDGGLYIYQGAEDAREQIDGIFVLLGDTDYGFEITGEYDRTKELVIDPLVYSTFLGGTSPDYAYDNALDYQGSGQQYVTGYTQSSNFPTTVGAYDTTFNFNQDVFVTKFNTAGSNLIFSTFLGGNASETGMGIDVDSNGFVYVTGETDSWNFPTLAAYDSTYNGGGDVFVTKLNSTGSNLIWSTYVGGNGSDAGRDIAVNSAGQPFITGNTNSSNFPTASPMSQAWDSTYNGSGDAFLFKFWGNTTMFYSTFIGGNSSDVGTSVEIYSDLYAVVTGHTFSNNFPTYSYYGSIYDATYNGGGDAFAVMMNAYGVWPQYSTYLGGSGTDIGAGVDVDSQGSAYVTGQTQSTNFPTTSGAYQTSLSGSSNDVFVTKLAFNGSVLTYSTYIGGTGMDQGYGIAVNDTGAAYVTGSSSSSNFPVTSGAHDATYNGNEDSIGLILDSNGTGLVYSTYIGGMSLEKGHGIDIDSSGSMYIAGYTGSSNFPTTNGAYDTTKAGGNYSYDAFALKISFGAFMTLDTLGMKLGNTPTTQAYSKYAAYTFPVEVINPVSLTDVTDVRLTLDPSGAGVVLRWDRASSAFSVVYDPSGYVSIAASSNAVNDGVDTWTVEFDVIFNWNYPHEGFGNLSSTASSASLSTAYNTANSAFRVENDLDYAGTLTVTGPQGALTSGDWVGTGASLGWGGLTVVYEGTSNVYPADAEFDVTVYDDDNGEWSDTMSSGGPISIVTTADPATDTTDIHEVRITGVPAASVAADQQFEVRIDGDEVGYSDPSPPEEVWQTSAQVTCAVSIEDLLGSGVSAGSVDYRTSTDDGGTWSAWTSAGLMTDSEQLIAQAQVTFPEGDANLIQWRATDAAGNGPTDSLEYGVPVDTLAVTFGDAMPEATIVKNKNFVLCSIDVLDATSGVDGASIEYKVKRDGESSFSAWTSAESDEEGESVTAEVVAKVRPGDNNLIRWRATDLAGHDPAVSGDFQIKVDVDDVTFKKFNPSHLVWNTYGTLSCSVDIEDDGAAEVDTGSVEYRKSKDGGTTWTGWEAAAVTEDSGVVTGTAEISFPDGDDNLLQWRASDTAGNGPAASDPQTVLVDTMGVVFSDPVPVDGAEVEDGEVEVGITISDAASGVMASTVEYLLEMIDSGSRASGGWEPVPGLTDGPVVDAGLTLDLEPGTDITVLFRAGDIAGNAILESGPIRFTVAEDDTVVPVVTLLSPEDGAMLEETSVRLTWEPPMGMTDWTYDVYLDTDNPPSALYAEGVDAQHFDARDLWPDTTYYWTVVASDTLGTRGVYGDVVFSFTISSPDGPGEPVENVWGVSLSEAEDQTLGPGEILKVDAELTNQGDAPDVFAVTLQAGELTAFASLVTDIQMSLAAGGTGTVTVQFVLTRALEPGDYDVTVVARSLGASGIGDEVSDSTTFTVTVLKADTSGLDPGGEKAPSGEGISEYALPIGIAAGALAAITFPWWWVALLFIFAPLMVRLGNKDEKEKWRDRILGTIMSKPGIHFSGIKAWLDTSNGTLIYNLTMLERDGRIVSRRDGFFKRFYPTETELHQKPPEFLTMEDKIAIIVRDNPGAAQSEIAYLLEDSWQKVHYHVKKMEAGGLLRSEPNADGHPRYHLSDNKEAVVKRREIFGKTVVPPVAKKVEGGGEDGVESGT